MRILFCSFQQQGKLFNPASLNSAPIPNTPMLTTGESLHLDFSYVNHFRTLRRFGLKSFDLVIDVTCRASFSLPVILSNEDSRKYPPQIVY